MNFKALFYSLIITILVQNLTLAQNFQTLTGTVFDKTSKQAISGANVTLANLGGVSDNTGKFIIEKIPTGRHKITVSHVGYKTLIISEVVIDASKQKFLEIALEQGETTLQEVQVHATPSRMEVNPVSAKVFSVEETQRFAASFYDPARLAMSFAGTTATNNQNNNISVRGTSPDLLGWRLEGVPILNPNHLTTAGMQSNRSSNAGGGTIIFSAQMLDNSQFIAGGLGSEMSNNAVGIFDMHLRKGNNQKAEHTIQAGLLGFDLSTEGPFSQKSKASYLVNYRYSFTGLLAKMGVNFGDESIGYQDLAVNVNLPTAKRGTFNAFLIKGSSYNDFARKPEAEQLIDKDKNDIYYDSRYFLTGVSHRKNLGQKSNWSSTLLYNSAIDDNEINFTYQNTDKKLLAFTTKIESNFNNKLSTKFGLNLNQHQLNLQNEFSNSNISIFSIMPFVSSQFKISNKFLAFGGVSYQNNKFNANKNIELKNDEILPNLGLNYVANQKLNFTINYSKQANPLNFSNVFNHFIVSSIYKKETSQLKTEAYLMKNNINDYWGVELSYDKKFTNHFYLLTNLAYFTTDVIDVIGREQVFKLTNRFTSNLTFGKEYKKFKKAKDLTRGFNARLFFHNPSGDLYNISNQSNLTDLNYFRIDARLYSKRQKSNFTRTWSLDIQNLTNAQNFSYFSTERFAGKKPVDYNYKNYQLGLIPVINYRVEF